MMKDLPGLRAQAEALLARADATRDEQWHITAEEHSTLVSLAEAFDMELPLVGFRSAAGVSRFLRVAMAAMREA